MAAQGILSHWVLEGVLNAWTHAGIYASSSCSSTQKIHPHFPARSKKEFLQGEHQGGTDHFEMKLVAFPQQRSGLNGFLKS